MFHRLMQKRALAVAIVALAFAESVYGDAPPMATALKLAPVQSGIAGKAGPVMVQMVLRIGFED